MGGFFTGHKKKARPSRTGSLIAGLDPSDKHWGYSLIPRYLIIQPGFEAKF